MLFNLLSCLFVLLISAIIFAVIYGVLFLKVDDSVEARKYFINITVWGTLIIFMWIMSWQNLWR